MKDKSGIYVAGLSFGYASAFHHSDPLADQWQHDANQTHSQVDASRATARVALLVISGFGKARKKR
jgi:hypothetical protein